MLCVCVLYACKPWNECHLYIPATVACVGRKEGKGREEGGNEERETHIVEKK